MRTTETQAGKGYKLQTLRAIELFLNAVDKFDNAARIIVSTENKGDILININNTEHIGESKNYQASHSINSPEVLNTLVNFLDFYITSEQKENISFGFYSTANKTSRDNFGFENSVLQNLESKSFKENILTAVKEKVIETYTKTYANSKGHVDAIEKFTNNDWKEFLTKIDWGFNLEGNHELNETLRKRIKDSPFLQGREEFNGIENSIVNEFKNQLEEIQEKNGYFCYKDFQNIVLHEIISRVDKSDLGEFKQITNKKPLNEVKIPYARFFFTEKERGLINLIKEQFKYSKDGTFARITGTRAQGKTTLAIQVGLEMEKENYLVLFLDLSTLNSNILPTLKAINKKHSDVICIITNCHLNLSAFRKIVIDSTEYNHIKFLFESRPLHKEHIDDDLNFIDDIETYHLTFNDNDLHEKYIGIINTYFKNISLSSQFVNTLMQATGRNFVYLFEFLNNITAEEFKDFSNINTKEIKRKVQDEFLKKLTKNEKLINYAAINQYEIFLNCSKEEQESWFKELINKDSVLINNKWQTEYYRFYHSDFAKLLVSAYYESRNFRKIEQVEFEKKIFIKYLTTYDLSELRVETIFSILYSNAAKELLSSILSDETLRNKIYDYYKNSKYFISSKPIREILRYVHELCPTPESEYLSELIIKNKNIAELLKRDNSFILTLLKTSSYFQNAQSEDYKLFADSLSTHLLDAPKNIAFSTMCYYLSSSNKTDKILFGLLKEIFTEKVLLQKAEKDELLTLTEGLGVLYQVYSTENKFIETIPLEVYSRKAEEVSLKRLSKALQNLENLNRKKLAEEIFASYSDDKLKNQLQRLHLKEALSAANILKNYGYVKVHKTFQPDKFMPSLERYAFVDLMHLIVEVNKFIQNPKQSTDFVSAIDPNSLKEKIQEENPYLVARHLHQLWNFRGCGDKANDIYRVIPNEYFINKTNELSFLKLGELLHWLNKMEQFEQVKNKKTKTIFQLMPINYFQKNIEDESFGSIVLSLNNLNKICKIKTAEILELNKNIIFEKLGIPNYNEIGLSLRQLSDVNPGIAFNILNSLLNKAEFKNWLSALPLHKFGRTLKEFFVIETNFKATNKNSIIRDYYNAIDIQTIIKNSKDLRFDLLCSSLNELHTIEGLNHSKAHQFVNKIDFDFFLKKVSDCDFSGLGQGFSNLTKVNPAFSTSIFTKAFANIVQIASSSSLEKLSDGLNAIGRDNTNKAKMIFTDANLNLKELAQGIVNDNLDSIKRSASRLKFFSPEKTKELIKYFNTENLVFKFEKEKDFDKATEYLSHLFVMNNDKIREVVTAIGADKIYNRCKGLEIKMVAQGLSKIFKINEAIAQTVMHRIVNERDIKKELSLIPQFADLTQKISVINKITANDELIKEILEHVGVSRFSKKAENSSIKQLELGFAVLSDIDYKFSRRIATELCQARPKYVNIFNKSPELSKFHFFE